MTNQLPVHGVEVRFVGAPPALQVKRASGVSAVEIDGPTLRCLVCGSFQPFLEALRGHEVITLKSTAANSPLRSDTRTDSNFEGGNLW